MLLMIFPFTAHAILSMELTRGVVGALPIAVVPFGTIQSPQDVSRIIATDLQNSGRFRVVQSTANPTDASQVSVSYFRKLGTDNVLLGKTERLGNDQYRVSFQLVDIFRAKDDNKVILSKSYTVPGKDLRAVAHHISDLVYQQLTGMRGIFSTKLAYIVVKRTEKPVKYMLEVADHDGFNPRTLLTSPEPIMSPAWSPMVNRLRMSHLKTIEQASMCKMCLQVLGDY